MTAKEAAKYSDIIADNSCVIRKHRDNTWFMDGDDARYEIEDIEGNDFYPLTEKNIPGVDKNKTEKQVREYKYYTVCAVVDAEGNCGVGLTESSALTDYDENIAANVSRRTILFRFAVPVDSFVAEVNVRLNDVHEVKITDLLEKEIK